MAAIETRLQHLVHDGCEEHQAEIEELEQVHLLNKMDPHLRSHRLVKLIKGRASGLLRQEFPLLKRKLPTLGTNVYCVATTGGASPTIIKQ